MAIATAAENSQDAIKARRFMPLIMLQGADITPGTEDGSRKWISGSIAKARTLSSLA